MKTNVWFKDCPFCGSSHTIDQSAFNAQLQKFFLKYSGNERLAAMENLISEIESRKGENQWLDDLIANLPPKERPTSHWQSLPTPPKDKAK